MNRSNASVGVTGACWAGSRIPEIWCAYFGGHGPSDGGWQVESIVVGVVVVSMSTLLPPLCVFVCRFVPTPARPISVSCFTRSPAILPMYVLSACCIDAR